MPALSLARKTLQKGKTVSKMVQNKKPSLSDEGFLKKGDGPSGANRIACLRQAGTKQKTLHRMMKGF
ncbi:hypothetical protein HYN59_01685 [Flavobacterium album]|uniref:Uncharacterized protein n=1 Tax=Flavobacterium album TaxID=2175091 RepID=A0A2S1QU60_9FLAO|nr:hypothetical protein HYN59_01685 [Flavobacterium album]